MRGRTFARTRPSSSSTKPRKSYHLADLGWTPLAARCRMLDRAPLTRRRLLQTTGALLAASWPLGSAKAFASAAPAAPVSDLMERLSTYMAGAAARPLPEPVVEKTKQMVLDTFAAMISGSALPPGRFAIRFARASGGVPSPDGPARRASGGARRTRDRRGLALVVGSNLLCRPIDAALANGMLAHADETDDTHPPSQSHPGCAVVPAALAVGERFGIDGARLLRSVALGYDVGPRVTATLGRLQYMVDSHRSTHSIAGTFGAAAAAGCAAGLGPRLLAARLRAHREGVRLRRHAGEERRHRRPPRPGRRHRRRRCAVGRGPLLPGVRSAERGVDARRRAGRSVRDHADERQEVDRRRPDPGAARRARGAHAPRGLPGGRSPGGRRARGDQRGEDRRQPRDPRHLAAAPD